LFGQRQRQNQGFGRKKKKPIRLNEQIQQHRSTKKSLKRLQQTDSNSSRLTTIEQCAGYFCILNFEEEHQRRRLGLDRRPTTTTTRATFIQHLTRTVIAQVNFAFRYLVFAHHPVILVYWLIIIIILLQYAAAIIYTQVNRTVVIIESWQELRRRRRNSSGSCSSSLPNCGRGSRTSSTRCLPSCRS